MADGYLFAVTGWAKGMGVDMAPYPNINAWRERVAARPAVQEALAAEAAARK